MSEENTSTSTEQAEQTTEQTPQEPAPEQKADNMIPKSRFDQVVNQKNELNETLKGLVDELKQDIPQDMQDLIPDMKPQDQIKWLRNATKKGLFNTVKADGPDSNTPGPSNNDVDLSSMDAYNKLLYGFNK